MDGDRLARVVKAVRFGGGLDPASYSQHICDTAASFLDGDGAGLSLVNEQGVTGAIWASNDFARSIEDLQFALGEGPTLDAIGRRTPALVSNLAEELARWPIFGPDAIALGVAAIYSFPLQLGAIRLGTLDLFERNPRHLSSDTLADALVLADVLTQDFIDLQGGGELSLPMVNRPGQPSRVHQATGMVSAQIDSDMASSLARIRAYAFANDMTIFEVTEQVLARNLRFGSAQ